MFIYKVAKYSKHRHLTHFAIYCRQKPLHVVYEKSDFVHEPQLDAATSDKQLSLPSLACAKAARQKRAIEEHTGKELDPKRVWSDNCVLQPKVFHAQESSMLQFCNSPRELLEEDLHQSPAALDHTEQS